MKLRFIFFKLTKLTQKDKNARLELESDWSGV